MSHGRIFSLVFLAALIGAAQEFRATLQGNVVDPSQAGIPGATVILRNVDTGIERTAPTDETGHYIFQSVRRARPL